MKNEIFLRTPYNYDRDKASNESALHCKDQSLTKQSFAEDADINTIVRRFGLTGQLPDNVRVPQYGDFTEVFDFHTAMNAVRTAQESFMALPPNIRARFHNDPQELLEFCEDPENRPEAIRIGLVERKPEPQGGPTSPPQGSPSEPQKAPPPAPAPEEGKT